ncbi:MAG: ornithine carbamoyltransferase [Acidobacteriota bacterium]
MDARSFLSVDDLTAQELGALFELTRKVKATPKEFANRLEGMSLAMIFQKSSTRTRVSFEVGMTQLGGQALFLSASDLQLGRGETVADTARVLSRYVDGIMARTFAHSDVEDLAQFGTVPVINGLTDLLHPCQAVADYFTLSELFPDLRGRKLTYVGDGNNVAHSLLLGAPKVGMDIAVATPKEFEPDPTIVGRARRRATEAGTEVQLTHDPAEAVVDASAIYTDVWASMGQESEAEQRRRLFEGYTVDSRLMSLARPDAVFLHCLPCHRGEEVSAEVVDGPQSKIFREAENRLHAQKAILIWLMGGESISG